MTNSVKRGSTIFCWKAHYEGKVVKRNIDEMRDFLKGKVFDIEESLLSLKMGYTIISKVGSMWCEKTYPEGYHHGVTIGDVFTGEAIVEISTGQPLKHQPEDYRVSSNLGCPGHFCHWTENLKEG